MKNEVAVVIASLGRPNNLSFILERLSAQTQLPSIVVLSMESEDDCPELGEHEFDIKTIFAPRGMTVQRNRGMDLVLDQADVVVFYDDDYVPSKFAIEGISRVFTENAEIVGATGHVIADGITSTGISFEEASRLVEKYDADKSATEGDVTAPTQSLYGCNMAYRISSIGDTRFDEDLPLYGWLEDVDFSAALNGPLVETDAFSGVHCGEKSGRERSGMKLGYSQVANPLYLYNKGTLPISKALKEIVRTAAKNHLMVFKPEPWIDRKGRVRGNWAAVKDLLFGKIAPNRILELH